MKINKLLIGVVLAIAIVSPIAAFVGDKKVPQPTTSPKFASHSSTGLSAQASPARQNWPLSSARMFGSIRRR